MIEEVLIILSMVVIAVSYFFVGKSYGFKKAMEEAEFDNGEEHYSNGYYDGYEEAILYLSPKKKVAKKK